MFRTNATTIKGRKTSCTPLFITETLVIYKLLLNSVQKITKKSRIMDRMFELLQEDTHFQQNSWESKSSRLKKKKYISLLSNNSNDHEWQLLLQLKAAVILSDFMD